MEINLNNQNLNEHQSIHNNSNIYAGIFYSENKSKKIVFSVDTPNPPFLGSNNNINTKNEKCISTTTLLTNKITEPLQTCRICFRADSGICDPLLTPCCCNGSMAYIHFKCLKKCIEIRMIKKESENCICYILKNYECEICLKEYPKYIKYKNTFYNLIDFSVPFTEYMVLDYSLYDDLKKKVMRKGVIIINIFNEEIITIGRSQNNKVKLKDISISRNHCVIIRKNCDFYIMDKGSKFGTLIYLNRPFTLTVDNIFQNEPNNRHKNTSTKSNGKYYNINNASNININKNSDKNYSSLFQPSEIIGQNINIINESSNEKDLRENKFIDKKITLVAGKVLMCFQISKSWSLFGGFFSKAICCKYINHADDEFILEIDNEINRKTEFNENANNQCNSNPKSKYENFYAKNLEKERYRSNYLNDSYADYFLHVDTIIRHEDNALDENNKYQNSIYNIEDENNSRI